VLFVSNDISYQNAPLHPHVGYASFSIHRGRKVAAATQLNRNGALAVANGQQGFTVNHSYTTI
jgi:hypothetical protein